MTLVHININTNNFLFLFGGTKLSSYICKTNNKCMNKIIKSNPGILAVVAWFTFVTVLSIYLTSL